MNRKKFILALSVIGVGSLASYYGFKLAKIKGNPDIKYLDINKDLVADLCDNIIPQSSSPGAKEAQAFEYVLYAIKHSKDNAFKNNFINGLKEVQSYCESNFEQPFTKLNKIEQHQVMIHFQKEGKNFEGSFGKVRNKILGKSFFAILKETTTIGYCTSMIGAKNGLAYEYVPGRFIGCTDYVKGQKSWATK